MKRYIRTKDNKIYDTTKERYLIDGERLVLAHEYETHPTMTNGKAILSVYITEKHVEYNNCGFIDKESDNILDLIQVGDLIQVSNVVEDNYDDFDPIRVVNKKVLDLIQDRIENYNFKNPEKLSIYKLYTKQGDNYVLVWDKKRGII